MTHLSSTAITIGALSLAVVTLFKIVTPEVPIRTEDTQLVVGACAAAVVSMRWAIRKWTHRGVQP